ncbi:MAG: glycosyltransferase [Candidatus Poribacteria bacterium]|nr:glycosyltransferase [Candidatus Poribacteria bacterium]
MCLLTHSYPRFLNDATAPFVESTAETLQKHGVDVTVLTPDTPKFARTKADHTVNLQTYRYFFPRRFQLLGYSNTLVNDCELKRYVYLLAPFMFLSAISHLFRLHHKYRFDVIHAQWLLPNGFIGAVLCKVYKLPLVITMQGSDMFVAKQNPFFKWLAAWTLKQTAMVTSVTPTFLPELAALDVPEAKRCLIPNGVDPEVFSSASSKLLEKQSCKLRKYLSIPEDNLVIFALGRIVLKKGFDVLIQVLPLVKEQYPSVTVIIGGDGTDLGRLKTLTKELGISENIRFPGTITRADVPTYFYLCDIFTLPAVFDPKGNVDGCPNVILEAMACGKSVVSSNISGIPGVVKNGETGILVKEKNVEKLTAALVDLLTDTEKREKFGRAGRERILNELTWDKIIEQFKDVYQNSVNCKN